MSNALRRLLNWFKRTVRSLAFLPVPMLFASLLVSFILSWVEDNTDISSRVSEWLPSYAIVSADTARTILGMFIGALITLVVFTFSQIMILLNQVTANYSPRLLPKFTADRSLQFVMGLNLSVIVVMIAVLMSIRSVESATIPNFSILLVVLMGIACLLLFLYFVTTISHRIQVSSIVQRVAQDTIKGIDYQRERENYYERTPPRNTAEWYAIPSPIGGYLGTVNFSKLSELAKKHNTRFFIGVAKGEYVPKNFPIIQSEHQLDEDGVNAVLAAVAPILTRFDDWYLPNLKQLVEIALKAMSPGINDPGTALTVVDRLTEVFGRLMAMPFHNVYQTEEGGEVWFHVQSYDQVLAGSLQELRAYSTEDPMVSRRLFQMLYHLLDEARPSTILQRSVYAEIRALLFDVRRRILNPHDRRIIANDLRFHRRAYRLAPQNDYLTDANVDNPGVA